MSGSWVIDGRVYKDKEEAREQDIYNDVDEEEIDEFLENLEAALRGEE